MSSKNIVYKTYIDNKINNIEEMLINSGYLNPHNNRIELTESGKWTAPANLNESKGVTVFLVGGGGGGSYKSNFSNPFISLKASGGGGYTALYRNISISANEEVSYIVGSGGTTHSYVSGTTGNGTNGGYTQFKSSAYKVLGGNAGYVDTTSNSNTGCHGGNGGSGGGVYFSSSSSDYITSDGQAGYNGSDASNGTVGTVNKTGFTCNAAGGTGQGNSTEDVYSKITYASGGGKTSTGKYGDGGFSSTNGKSGVIILYYSTIEEETT